MVGEVFLGLDATSEHGLEDGKKTVKGRLALGGLVEL